MSGQSESGFAFAVVLLAAGRSSRMGQPKLLLPWGGTSILGHLLQQWTGLGAAQIAVVFAAGDQLLHTELDRVGFPSQARVRNPEPERGMFSSIQCAATWEGWQPGLSHWVIALGDQPHLARATLATLIDFASTNPRKICQPSHHQRPRHPVVLPQIAFFNLRSAPAQNLKEFCAPYAVALCEIDDPGLDLDLDRPEDYEHARQQFACERRNG